MATYLGFNEPSTTRGTYDIGDNYVDVEMMKMMYPINSNESNPDNMGSSSRYDTDNEEIESAKVLFKETKVTVITQEDAAPLPAQQAPQPVDDVIESETSISVFSQQLKNSYNMPYLRYMPYAKLDGDGFVDYPRKSFKIFMTMLPEEYQNYPYNVCILAKATIHDLIGLTCYKYSVEHPEITLGSVQDYGLCIADDDGEVDWDFPCFDVNESCIKLGFKYLGLIELKKKPSSIGILLYSDDEISLGSSSGIICNQRRTRLKDPNNDGAPEPDISENCTYEVHLIRTLRSNLLVHLSISPNVLEVTPLIRRKKSFWQNKNNFFMHNMDTVARCQVLRIKGKLTTFRIIYSQIRKSVFSRRSVPTDLNYNVSGRNTIYQCHEFVADNEIAKKIIVRLNTLLNMRNGPSTREYRQLGKSRARPNKSSCFSCFKLCSWFS